MWARPLLPLSPLISFVLSEQFLPLLSSNFPSSLPILSYPLSLSSSCFLSLLMLPTSTPTSSSVLSRLHPPPRLSDVALGFKKSRFIEFLALWELLFDYDLNGNPLQCSCLENPRDGGAWWAAVSGVAQSQTRLKRLRSSSSSHSALDREVTCQSCLVVIHAWEFDKQSATWAEL